MPFSSGVFNRIYSWTTDAANGVKIRADRMDAEMNGMATALSTCVLKDGTQTITANLPMNGFRHTGVGNASALTDYAVAGQVQDNDFNWCGTAGGTANAQTLSPSPNITAYAAGQKFEFLPVATNTSGTVTIATSGLTARSVKKSIGGALVDLAVGDLIIGVASKVVDDGTQYVLMNPQTYTKGADIASASTINLDTATGDLVDITGTTAITAVTLSEGRQCTVRFQDILTFTHGASLVLPGSANITTAAGDFAILRGYASGVVRCVSYTKASGLAVVVPSVTVYYNTIAGFVPSSIAGTNTTASLTLSAGQTTDSTNAEIITKASTTSWAVSNGNAANGYQGGTTLPNSDTIHIFIISGSSGVASFAHNGLTPTLPSGYSVYKRVASFNTTGAGAPIPYITVEGAGGTMRCLLTTMTGQTISVTTSDALYTLTGMPTDIRVRPIITAALQSSNTCIMYTDGITSAAPASNGTAPGNNVSNSGSQTPAFPELITNTSGQVRARAGSNDSLYIYGYGWEDFRR